MQIDCWHECYKDDWKGFIVPEAFTHPAKYAKGLIFRILDHALAEGWLRPGDICADPFGGVALGAFPKLLKGINWLGCELEERFVDLGRQNLAYWQQRYGHRMQGAQAVLVQGDSRDLCAVLGKQVAMLVSSPPYVDRCANDNQRTIAREGLQQGHNEGDGHTYGATTGNLATVVPGQVEAVICSPPWTDQLVNHDTPEGYQALKDKIITSGNGHPGSFCLHGGPGYGKTPGNLGNLPTGHADAVISSPPYAEGLSKEHTYQDHAKRDKESHRRIMTEKGIVDPHYGTTPGNLGNLGRGMVDVMLSSPPYTSGTVHDKGQHAEDYRRVGPNGYCWGTRAGGGFETEAYGTTDGQLGNASSETFWQAAAQILHQCFALLRPRGYAIFVTKAYVRDGALVPFPDDWRRLCEHVGFVPRHEHHALLSEHHGQEQSLFGGEVTRETRRISFFRRLSEKNGAPRIEYEVVHCFQKPD